MPESAMTSGVSSSNGNGTTQQPHIYGHKRANSSSSMFGHKRTESGYIMGHRRSGSAHKALEGLFGGHKRTDSGGTGHLAPPPGHWRNESMYALTGLYADSTAGGGRSVGLKEAIENAIGKDDIASKLVGEAAVIRCHSRNPSSGLVDHRLVAFSTCFRLLLGKKF